MRRLISVTLAAALTAAALLPGCAGKATAPPASPGPTPAKPGQPGQPPAASQPPSTDPVNPSANPEAFRGQGKLAFIAAGRLYVLDGSTAKVTAITAQGGQPVSPVWSADGQWLAFLYAESEGAPQQLHIARADGTAAETVKLPDGVVPWQYAWSPKEPVLALGAQSGLWRKAPGQEPVLLSAGQLGRGGLVWSPDGSQIAFAPVLPAPQPPPGTVVDTISPRGGDPTQLLAAPETAIHLAAWLPGKNGLLAWTGPMSASLSADGMLLEHVAPDGKLQGLTGMLAYPEWLAFSPDQSRLVAVAGGGRMAWVGKGLALCDLASASAAAAGAAKEPCTAIPHPAGKVDLDPAWSPKGDRIAFVRADEVRGDLTHPSLIEQWVPSRTLWLSAPDGSEAKELTAAGQGIYQPQWSADGSHLLFVRASGIYLLGENDKEPVLIAGPLASDPNLFGYYGFAPTTAYLAWYRP
jgi:TolB protein